jgi:hypothetical protein
MLRRQKGVERSAEDLAASIAAAHAMLGLNPEPALAQLGISRMALEAIMKQPDPIREAVGAQPPPPENLMRMPLARRPTLARHNLFEQHVEIDLVGLESETLRLQPRKVQQVPNKTIETKRLSRNGFVRRLTGNLIIENAISQGVDLAANRRQWCAQLVRNAH